MASISNQSIDNDAHSVVSDIPLPVATSLKSSGTSQDIGEGVETETKAYTGDIESQVAQETGGMATLSRTRSIAQESLDLSRALTETERIEDKYDASEAIPLMGSGREYPPKLPDSEAYIVTYSENDPMFPHNWSFKSKMLQCLILGFDTLAVAFGSSIFAEAIPYVCVEFGVAQVVGTLGVSLYVIGFATGPIIWGPASELYGRKPVLLLSSIGFMCFTFAAATAKDLQTLMICRFFAGCIGAGPLAVVPATFSDMFDNDSRGKAVVLFSMAVFVGPMVAPILGAFIAKSYLGWRWTLYLTGIMGSAATVGVVFCQRESHHLVVLTHKAKIIRDRTGNWGIHAARDEVTPSLKEIVEKNLYRPIRMLLHEPILILISVYTAFVYGILYLCLTAIPVVFQEGYGFVSGVAELPYISLIIGIVLGGIVCLMFEPLYKRKLEANGGKILPEARLPAMMVGAVIFPIGLFWLCWTGNYYESVHWIVPTIGASFIGFGLITIFIPALNYIIDTYLIYAASAIAANTFLRSIFGGVFPLFSSFMFAGMGTNWAGLLIGLMGVALLPVPFLFAIYGKRIRTRSKFGF